MSVAVAPPVSSSQRAQLDRRALETHRLLVRYRRHGDLAARDELVSRFLPLARQLARRYRNAGEPLDDLVQVACVGLVKAIDRFDLDRGVALSSYAVPTMLGELKRYFRDSGWAVHVPRGLQERVARVDRAVETLSSRDGRAPAPQAIAGFLGLSLEDVLETLEAGRAYDAASLDAPRRGVDAEPDAQTVGDGLGAEDAGYELVEYSDALAGTLAALPDRDREILELRFRGDLTQSEIAARVGVSQMQVSRLLRRSLDRLRAVAEAG